MNLSLGTTTVVGMVLLWALVSLSGCGQSDKMQPVETRQTKPSSLDPKTLPLLGARHRIESEVERSDFAAIGIVKRTENRGGDEGGVSVWQFSLQIETVLFGASDKSELNCMANVIDETERGPSEGERVLALGQMNQPGGLFVTKLCDPTDEAIASVKNAK